MSQCLGLVESRFERKRWVWKTTFVTCCCLVRCCCSEPHLHSHPYQRLFISYGLLCFFVDVDEVVNEHLVCSLSLLEFNGHCVWCFCYCCSVVGRCFCMCRLEILTESCCVFSRIQSRSILFTAFLYIRYPFLSPVLSPLQIYFVLLRIRPSVHRPSSNGSQRERRSSSAVVSRTQHWSIDGG